MRGSRIEGSTVVAEMVLSVNLMSPTIEQVASPHEVDLLTWPHTWSHLTHVHVWSHLTWSHLEQVVSKMKRSHLTLLDLLLERLAAANAPKAVQQVRLAVSPHCTQTASLSSPPAWSPPLASLALPLSQELIERRAQQAHCRPT